MKIKHFCGDGSVTFELTDDDLNRSVKERKRDAVNLLESVLSPRERGVSDYYPIGLTLKDKTFDGTNIWHWAYQPRPAGISEPSTGDGGEGS